jgi:putative ABC transport system substrate-binding protein
MQRREFIVLLGGVATALPLASAAQQAVKRVGLVGLTGAASMSLPVYQTFQRRLAELGWVEGKNLAFEPRWSDGQVQRLPQLIDEVAGAQPEVIYVLSSAAAVAAKNANLKIPVVFSHATDPVASGVVQTLGRHDGNITGVTYSVPEWLENFWSSCAKYGRHCAVSVLYGRRASRVSSQSLNDY